MPFLRLGLGFSGKSGGEQDALLRRDGGWRRLSSERGGQSHRRVIIRLPGNVGESQELVGREQQVGSEMSTRGPAKPFPDGSVHSSRSSN